MFGQLKEIGVRFQLFGQLKYHIRAARHGDHFLSERPEKCVPMAGGSSVISCLSVIQDFRKTLNLCIIKTPESPVPAEPYAKSRAFE
jgi:hypothetical protein